MNQLLHDPKFEVASALSIGKRDCQEDTIIVDFPKGANHGCAVLADGMGGHAAGDVASKLVATAVHSMLKHHSANPKFFDQNMKDILQQAALTANECVRDQTLANPSTNGMGTTLVATVLRGDRLNWISIGDSPLFLFRNAKLTRLNENHSLAERIDLMAKSGLISEDMRRNHPDRNCLSSGLVGEKIALIDCPDTATQLKNGDIVVVASDGLHALLDEELEQALQANKSKNCATIAQTLMQQIEEIGDPEQDNTAISVIKFSTNHAKPAQADLISKHKKEIATAASLADALPKTDKGHVLNFFFFEGQAPAKIETSEP